MNVESLRNYIFLDEFSRYFLSPKIEKRKKKRKNNQSNPMKNNHQLIMFSWWSVEWALNQLGGWAESRLQFSHSCSSLSSPLFCVCRVFIKFMSSKIEWLLSVVAGSYNEYEEWVLRGSHRDFFNSYFSLTGDMKILVKHS